MYIYLYAGDLIRCSFVSSGSEMNQHSLYMCKVSAQDQHPAAPSLQKATAGEGGAALALCPGPQPKASSAAFSQCAFGSIATSG